MFGYQLVSTSETNRNGRLINILCVEEQEAEYVRELFRMTAEEDKGTHQLAEYLNNKGIKTHNSAKFQPTNIMRILKNRIYIGHLDAKDIKDPYQENLRIIDDDTFCCYSTNKNGERKRYDHKDYVCGNRANLRCDFDGQAGYKIAVIDGEIENMVTNILNNIADTPESVAIAKTYEATGYYADDLAEGDTVKLDGELRTVKSAATYSISLVNDTDEKNIYNSPESKWQEVITKAGFEYVPEKALEIDEPVFAEGC